MTGGAVVVGRQLIGASGSDPRVSGSGPNAQWPELVKGVGAVGMVFEHVIDHFQLRLVVGVVGVLPGAGALEGDRVPVQQAAQGFAARHGTEDSMLAQVGVEFAYRPMREWLARFLGAGQGRLEDEVFIVNGEQAGTASRPVWVHAVQPDLVESVDHLPNGVFVRGDEAGDDRDGVAAGGGQQDRGPPPADHVASALRFAAAHDPLQPLTFLRGQPAHFHTISHASSMARFLEPSTFAVTSLEHICGVQHR